MGICQSCVGAGAVRDRQTGDTPVTELGSGIETETLGIELDPKMWETLQGMSPVIAVLGELGLPRPPRTTLALASTFTRHNPNACAEAYNAILTLALTGCLSRAYMWGESGADTQGLHEAAMFLGLEWLLTPVLDTEVRGAFIVPNQRPTRVDRFEVELAKGNVSLWRSYRKEIESRAQLLLPMRAHAQPRLNELHAELADAANAQRYEYAIAPTWVLIEPPRGRRRPDFQALERGVRALPGLPWCATSPDGAGVVVAGGSIEAWLRGDKPKDIDCFIVVRDGTHEERLQRAWLILQQCIDALCEKDEAFVVYKDHVINVYTRPGVIFQFVAVMYTCPAQVIGGFDIDSCRVLYDGVSVKADAAGLRAWANGWNLFTPLTLSTSAVHRYAKKCEQGMGILLVGLGQGEMEEMDRVASGHVRVEGLLPTIDLLVLRIKNPAALQKSRTPRHAHHDYEADDSPGYMWYTRETFETDQLRHAALRVHVKSVTTTLATAGQGQQLLTGAFNPVCCDPYMRQVRPLPSRPLRWFRGVVGSRRD